MVNAVPLFIMAFFPAAFVLFAPFGFDPPRERTPVRPRDRPVRPLLVLTYFSARAIKGSELAGPTVLPGQTTPPGAEPLDHGVDEAENAGDEA